RGGALLQCHVLPMDLNRVPSRPTKIQFFVFIVESHVTLGIKANEPSINIRTTKGVIDEVVIRCVFINATAERAVDTRIRIIMPDLSRLKGSEIDLVFARSTVVACFARRLLKKAACTIVKEE